MSEDEKGEENIDYSMSWLIAEAPDRLKVIETLKRIKDILCIKHCRVIELGSGIGTNLRIFKEDCDVLGLEGIREVAEFAEESGIPTTVVNLDYPIKIKAQIAKAVLCIDVLEHLKNLEYSLKFAYDSMNFDSYLIINVPNHFDWRGRKNIFFGSGIDSQGYFPVAKAWSYPHLRFFTRQDIDELLLVNGFKVVRDFSSSFNSFPKMRFFRKVGLSFIPDWMRARYPNLFSYGFFIVAKKI